MPNELEAHAIRRLVDKANNLGVDVPAGIQALAQDHDGPETGGARLWVRAHPETADTVYGCCIADAVYGPERCTCWVPVYDLVQAPPRPGMLTVRDGMCGDCAYRPGSPERDKDFLWETLRDLPAEGRVFACHQGIRRAVAWEHPDGRRVDGDPADYQPPMVAGVPIQADGQPALLCAGWAAHGRRLDAERPAPDAAPPEHRPNEAGLGEGRREPAESAHDERHERLT